MTALSELKSTNTGWYEFSLLHSISGQIKIAKYTKATNSYKYGIYSVLKDEIVVPVECTDVRTFSAYYTSGYYAIKQDDDNESANVKVFLQDGTLALDVTVPFVNTGSVNFITETRLTQREDGEQVRYEKIRVSFFDYMGLSSMILKSFWVKIQNVVGNLGGYSYTIVDDSNTITTTVPAVGDEIKQTYKQITDKGMEDYYTTYEAGRFADFVTIYHKNGSEYDKVGTVNMPEDVEFSISAGGYWLFAQMTELPDEAEDFTCFLDDEKLLLAYYLVDIKTAKVTELKLPYYVYDYAELYNAEGNFDGFMLVGGYILSDKTLLDSVESHVIVNKEGKVVDVSDSYVGKNVYVMSSDKFCSNTDYGLEIYNKYLKLEKTIPNINYCSPVPSHSVVVCKYGDEGYGVIDYNGVVKVAFEYNSIGTTPYADCVIASKADAYTGAYTYYSINLTTFAVTEIDIARTYPFGYSTYNYDVETNTHAFKLYSPNGTELFEYKQSTIMEPGLTLLADGETYLFSCYALVDNNMTQVWYAIKSVPQT